jgi:hypothetical protein
MMTLLIVLLTAICLGWMAYAAGRGWFFWALGGALLGAVTTTFVLGVVEAACIPFDSHQASRLHLRAYGAAVLIIFVWGWLLTAGLHRHAQSLWKRVSGDKGP